MNQLKKQIKFFLPGFRFLPLPGKLYFRFSFVALAIMVLALIVLGAGRNIYHVGLETMLLFSVVYFPMLVVVIFSISPYKQEYNVFAGIVPALMTIAGLIIATYFWDLHLDPDSGKTQLIYPLLMALILPACAALLSRSIGIKAWKLYMFGAGQICSAALIAWCFYSGF